MAWTSMSATPSNTRKLPSSKSCHRDSLSQLQLGLKAGMSASGSHDALTLFLSSEKLLAAPGKALPPCSFAAGLVDTVRSISTNVRRNLAFHTLSQEALLKEFSTIS
ncbi:hypothetical protein H671_3g9915 [Cricetulus griseus]|uniref:Uncharacterized protein n=1 Tax=Cricetulus griseus TaxID=10029 RepID=A0A061ICC7_CRIGR|nr:hypothetical protein H671_3g9915 [Cricetulus griseus]